MVLANTCEKVLCPDGKSGKPGVTKDASWYGIQDSPITLTPSNLVTV
jgi:hypothetical protein